MKLTVILSNDMLLPFDVTTKDDLIYSISCDYSDTAQPHIGSVKNNVIEGSVANT
jgi:hypothetical protein